MQARIGHVFRDRSLLESSLTHPSVQQEQGGVAHNQRLEFLGDAVLQLVITERLHALFPDEREGALTQRRATLIRGAFLAGIALDLGLDRVLRVSAAERAAGGHRREAALEDAVEALVAAIFLDGGWETARKVVLGWFGDLHDHLGRNEQRINPKGRLQEHFQPRHGNSALAYRVVREEGPPHERTFEVEVLLLDRVIGRGAGPSKKEAEENAAREALRALPAEGA